ncbi:MAG: ArdC-like ssDNA-binding domain-containing protein [Chloroflexota bacterium]|nr:ArdC-like ssDNA-binding domain-containing protein [Chloroflexota bacterium]
MTEQSRYQQAAFDLTPTHHAPETTLPQREGDTPFIVPVDRDPATLPNRRLAGDFWGEFHLEWQFREQHGMEPVSPHEFADLRDFSDGVVWPAPDAEMGGVYGPSERYDDVLPDQPRDEHTVFDARQVKLDATIDMLARKVEHVVTGDGYRAYLRMLAKLHSYSANNIALILAQCPDATKVMGFGNKAGTTGWKSLGRHVRQGEKGITIIRPMHRTIADDASGEPVKVLSGFTTATVFDVSQTEGIPLPKGPTPEDLPQDEAARSLELDVALRRFIDEAGARVVRDHEGTKRGYWHPDRREIGIRADLTGVRALKTLAHETAHLLADHRREGIPAEDAETVAESVAFVLLDHYSIDTSSYSVPYIASWARSPEVMQRNLDMVRALSHTLLTALGDSCPPSEDGEGVAR